jgi:uncharacterized membrane protein YbjE (DUF340 family)
MVTLFIMIIGIVVGRLCPVSLKKINNPAQLLCTLLLIFSMGFNLGRQDGFFYDFGRLGFQSFLFFLLPVAGSVAVVYLLTRYSMPDAKHGVKRQDSKIKSENAKSMRDPMIFYAAGALLLGILCAVVPGISSFFMPLTSHSQQILYLLMFSVGISVGEQRGIFSKLLRYNVKILIIPFGTIVGSLIGGVLCGFLFKYPLNESLSISGSLGWYSLAGVSLSSMISVSAGSVAFLSSLMREIFSFILIPYISKRFNSYSCIAVAGATSEDTTLPMIMRYTDEKTAVFSVINGILCSAFVPVLFSFCH